MNEETRNLDRVVVLAFIVWGRAHGIKAQELVDIAGKRG